MKRLQLGIYLALLPLAACAQHSSGHDDDDGGHHRRGPKVIVDESVNQEVLVDQRLRQQINTYLPEVPDEILNIEAHPEQQTFYDIHPPARAKDYEDAFKEIRATAPDASIFAIVKGISFDHITELKALPSGTLVLMRTEHNGREDQHVVKVEEIEHLGLRRPVRTSSPATIPDSW